MALYSFYTGFIYNEWFSMPTYMFGKSRFACYNSTNQPLLYPAVAPSSWPVNVSYPGSLIYPGSLADARDCTHFGGSIVWPYGEVCSSRHRRMSTASLISDCLLTIISNHPLNVNGMYFES